VQGGVRGMVELTDRDVMVTSVVGGGGVEEDYPVAQAFVVRC